MAEYISRPGVASTKAAVSQFMNKVYGWMAVGLMLSAFTSYYIASNPNLVKAILGNSLIFYGLIIAQLGVVIGMSAMHQRLSANAARGLFLVYTVLTGTTLSVIFLVFTMQSIMSTFLITAGAFAGLSFFGYVTQRDLGPIGTFCTMGLWGLIILIFASLFIPALRGNTMQMMMGAIGVIVFSGLTAYDTQKIKSIYVTSAGTNETKQAVFGALNLYLDFINLFISLLRLFGNRN